MKKDKKIERRYQFNLSTLPAFSHDAAMHNVLVGWLLGLLAEANGISEDAYAKLPDKWKQYWIPME